MKQNSINIDKNDPTLETQDAGALEPHREMEQMGRAVKKNLSRQIQFMLNSCVNCGVCAESCHYYCATNDSEVIPVNKFKILARILQTHFHPVKSRLPFLVKHDRPDEQVLIDLYKAAYQAYEEYKNEFQLVFNKNDEK